MIGSRLGPYEILAELGSGGMGKVYRAQAVKMAAGLDAGTPVALKVIHAHLLETEGFFKRFLREAQIGQDVQHENVVRCFDCDATLLDGASQHFLVMEYVEGQTLRDLLQELERVPEELCRHIGREVAQGLAAIHAAGAVHRDLKPENVLITADHVVKVMDLGVARLTDEAIRLSQTGTFLGSLEYAAPEQFTSAGGEPDGRADLHALGVVLYELSTGQHPYRDDQVSRVLRNILDVTPRKVGELNPQLSPFFEEVVHTLIAKEPAQRFASASGLVRALDVGERSEWWRERATALRRETARPLRRIRIPRETALYGREDDLAKLHALYAQAEAGGGQVLLIEGEAGVGKTRLVDEFVGRLQQDGEDVNFLFGSYPPGGAATVAGAFATAYREHFGRDGLDEVLRSRLPATPLLVPAFAALLRGDALPKGAQALTKASLQTVFVHTTRALAEERTTIVLIDDLHFAPDEGLALFASLALAVPGHRILLVGTMRPEVSKQWTASVTRLEQAETYPLSRLGPKDLTRLLTDAFRSERLAEELAFRIAQKSDGNPFFTFEIIRGLREGQFITRQPDGTWVTTRQIRDIQVPSSVQDLVNARVADLTEEERDLLDVASCCGFEFDPLLVARALGLGQIPALKQLARVEKKYRLIRSAGANYAFDHHQVQEALYQGLHERLRQQYHAAIGDALEQEAGVAEAGPDSIHGDLAVALCDHFLKGGQGEQALPYLYGALNHLASGWHNAETIALADRALDVDGLLEGAARVDVLLMKNQRLRHLGLRDVQAAVVEEARAVAEGTGAVPPVANVELALGRYLHDTAHYDEAVVHLERALELFRACGRGHLEAQVVSDLGGIMLRSGRNAEARRYFERVLAIAREAGDRTAEAFALGNLANVDRASGESATSLAFRERNLAYFQEIGELHATASSHNNIGMDLQALGRPAEAQAHHEQGLKLAREIGDRQLESWTLHSLMGVAFLRGSHAEAEAHGQRQLALAREIGDPYLDAKGSESLALVHYACGRYGQALAGYARRLAFARETGDRPGEAMGVLRLGEVFLALGRHVEAEAHGEQALALSRELGAPATEAFALCVLAALAEEQGDLDRALGLAKASLALRRDLPRRDALSESWLQVGELQALRGDEEAARQALLEALAVARPADLRIFVAEASALLACLPGGDAGEAVDALESLGEDGNTSRIRYRLWLATGDRRHLESARHQLDEVLGHAPEEYRESMVKNVRLHREILEAWEAADPERAKRVEGPRG